MMLIVAISNEDAEKARRALAGIQHGKVLAYPTKSGRFAKIKVDYAYPTDARGRRLDRE